MQAAHLHRQSTLPGAAAGALRAVEHLLFRRAEETARRNAWSAVLEDRKRAKDRREAQHVMDALVASRTPRGDVL
ncbi:SCO2195 family GlnR-regulated protein [Actinacidiphila sp. bgisy167]|uniref:SCO2195 family GlnR-regulated protein n=1 Tax=Actinacidiphila sp. bgisy167 TaxID=3413797 RepID=UPI003D707B35